jgi:hypothetical protein
MTVLRIVARLTDSNGNPLSGKAIYFYASSDGSTWVSIGSSNTDSGGYAYVTYNATSRTWFKAEFRGDEYYEPASAVAVWEPSGGQSGQCSPLFRVGIEALDSVLFCVGGVGVTMSVLIVVLILLILLVLR